MQRPETGSVPGQLCPTSAHTFASSIEIISGIWQDSTTRKEETAAEERAPRPDTKASKQTKAQANRAGDTSRITDLHGDEAVVNAHLLGKEVRADGCLTNFEL